MCCECDLHLHVGLSLVNFPQAQRVSTRRLHRVTLYPTTPPALAALPTASEFALLRAQASPALPWFAERHALPSANTTHVVLQPCAAMTATELTSFAASS